MVVELDPHNVGVITIAHDRVKQVLGDGGEEPPDERGVDRGPLGVAHHGAGVDGAVNMIHEVVLAEEQREVRLPREVRGVGGVEDHGDACVDVDVADLSRVDGEGVGVGGGVGRHGGEGVGKGAARRWKGGAAVREARRGGEGSSATSGSCGEGSDAAARRGLRVWSDKRGGLFCKNVMETTFSERREYMYLRD